MFSFFKKKPQPDAVVPPAPVPEPVAVPPPAVPAAKSVFSPSSWFGGKSPDPAPDAAPPVVEPIVPRPRPAPVPPVVPAPVAAPAEPARQGWIDKLKTGLRKTGTGIQAVFVNAQIDEELYEELETALLMADTGVKATEYLLDDLRRRVKSQIATNAQQVGDGFGQQAAHLLHVGRHLSLDAATQVLKQELGRLHAGVGHQQRGFQLFVERIVDLRVDEHGLDAGACLAQAGLELVQPALAFGFRWGRFEASGRGDDGCRSRGRCNSCGGCGCRRRDRGKHRRRQRRRDRRGHRCRWQRRRSRGSGHGHGHGHGHGRSLVLSPKPRRRREHRLGRCLGGR